MGTAYPWFPLLVSLILSNSITIYPTVLASPSFVRQQVIDGTGTNDLISINTLRPMLKVSNDTGLTDILSVNYHSNGTMINATLWLKSKLYQNKQDATELTYAMYIDADFNNNTGYRGGDYLVIVGRDDANKPWGRWYKEVETSSGEPGDRTFEHNGNFTGFYANGSRYVNLYADLKKINLPEKYRIFFLAEQKVDDEWLADFTNWISIPPPDVTISSAEEPIVTQKETPKTVELQLKSQIPNIVNIYLSPGKNPCNITALFNPPTVLVDTSGIGSTEMTINVPDKVEVNQCRLPIIANLVVPSESIKTISEPHTTDNKSKDLKVSSQSVAVPSYVTVKIPSLSEQLKGFVEDWFNPISGIITTLIGIGSAVGGYLYGFKKGNKKELDGVNE